MTKQPLNPSGSRFVLPIIMLCVLGASVLCSAAEGAVGERMTGTKLNLSPAVDAKLTEFRLASTEQKLMQWKGQMAKEIAKIAQVTNLAPELVTKLDAIAAEAARQCGEGWAQKFDRVWRKPNLPSDETLIRNVDTIMARGDYARNEFAVRDYVRPQEHPVWIGGVKGILTAEQFAVWEKARDERKEALKKEIEEYLIPLVNAKHDRVRIEFTDQGKEIKRVLGLSQERGAQLDDLANAVADQSVGAWAMRYEWSLIAMDDEQRVEWMKNPSNTGGYDGAERWKAGVAKLLSPDEKQRWESFLKGTSGGSVSRPVSGATEPAKGGVNLERTR